MEKGVGEGSVARNALKCNMGGHRPPMETEPADPLTGYSGSAGVITLTATTTTARIQHTQPPFLRTSRVRRSVTAAPLKRLGHDAPCTRDILLLRSTVVK